MNEEVVFRGKKLTLVARDEPLPAGGSHRVAILRHPGAAVLLAFPDDRHLVLVRNWRRAVEKTLWELPAGTLDPGEDPAAGAGRELREETGFAAGKLELLRSFYPSPGLMDERMFLFRATDLTPGPPQLDVGERLEAEVVPYAQAQQWALDGTIQDGKSLVGLLLWERLRRRPPEEDSDGAAGGKNA